MDKRFSDLNSFLYTFSFKRFTEVLEISNTIHTSVSNKMFSNNAEKMCRWFVSTFNDYWGENKVWKDRDEAAGNVISYLVITLHF